MKLHGKVVALLTLFLFVSSAFGAPPMWPGQPKISAAYESLTIALKQVELSRSGEPKQHLARASAQLLAAKTQLDTAKKNKGSARLEAMEQIEVAEQEIEAAKTDSDRIDAAIVAITGAMEQVTRAAKNGK